MLTHQHEGLRFDGFDGVMDILGGDWQNAVYRVSLSAGVLVGLVRPRVILL